MQHDAWLGPQACSCLKYSSRLASKSMALNGSVPAMSAPVPADLHIFRDIFAMLKPSASIYATLIALAAIAIGPATALAQQASPRGQADNSKRCVVAESDASQRGNAGDADMESTYSSCRLLDGYVGMSGFVNDGAGQSAGFAKDDATPDLRSPRVSGRTHALDMFNDDESGAGRSGGLKKGGAVNLGQAGDDRFASSDTFPEWRAAALPGYVRADQGGDNTSLLASRDSGGGLPQTGGSVGGGGSSGGIDGSGAGGDAITPVIPAVPEPQSYLMILAGAAVLAWAARRQARKQANRA